MNRRTIVGICLFSCVLMLSIPLIPTVQSIEVEKEVKSIIEENINNILNNYPNISFLKLFIIYYIIMGFLVFINFYLTLYALDSHPMKPFEKLFFFVIAVFFALYMPIAILLAIILQPIKVIKTILTLIKYMILDIIENINEIIERIKTRIIVTIEIIIEILYYIKDLINPSYQANIT